MHPMPQTQHVRDDSLDDALQPSPATFNCFFDELTLIAGVKAGVLQQWIEQGYVCIMVTLHTLLRLHNLQTLGTSVSPDCNRAITWLNEITDQNDSPVIFRIMLEGPKQAFGNWAQVAKFLRPLPPTFSSPASDETESADESRRSITELYDDDDNFDTFSDIDSPTSREHCDSLHDSIGYYSRPRADTVFSIAAPKIIQPIGTGRPVHTKTNSNASSIGTKPAFTRQMNEDVPESLRGFFNHVLWRVKQDQSMTSQIESYIVVTNDSVKENFAKRFGIRTARLDQMRAIIATQPPRIFSIKATSMLHIKNNSSYDEDDDDYEVEDELLLQAPGKAAFTPTPASRPSSQSKEKEQQSYRPKGPQVKRPSPEPIRVDPNSFSRVPPSAPASHRGHRGNTRSFGSPRSGNSARFDRPLSSSGRGALYTIRRGGPVDAQAQAVPLDLSKPIDPNAFERGNVSGRGRGGRGGRGARGKLWEPS